MGGGGGRRRGQSSIKLSRAMPHGATPSLKGRARPDDTTPLGVAPRRTTRLAEESCQSMWRDLALPNQLNCQHGRLVAPKHMARPFIESRHKFWRDQKG